MSIGIYGVSMKFTYFSWVVIIGVLATGCSRPSKKQSTVTVQLPEAAQMSKTSDQVIYDNNSIDPVVSPTNLDAINCYVVGVAGAETAMARNTCGNYDSNNIYRPQLTLGQWYGGGAPGDKLEILVDSNVPRTFYLFGLYADANTCRSLQSTFDPNKMSKFYLLGKSENNILQKDEETVYINMNFDANAVYDDCNGEDFKSVIKMSLKASRAQLLKPVFPAERLLANICQRVDIALTDTFARSATYPSNLEFQLFKGPLINNSVQYTYDSAEDCVLRPSTSAKGTFTVPGNKALVPRWIKDVSIATNTYTPKTTYTNTGFTTVTTTLNTINPNTDSYDLIGPSKIAPILNGVNRCYEYIVYARNVSDSRYLDMTADDSFDLTVSDGVAVSDTSCPTAATATGSTVVSYTFDPVTNSKKFYASFVSTLIGTAISSFSFEVKFKTGDATNGYIPSTIVFPVQMGNINTIFKNVEFLGSSMPLVRNSCNGPYFISARNELGGGNQLSINDLSNDLNFPVDYLKLKIKVDGHVEVYSTASCTGTPETITLLKTTNLTPIYFKTFTDTTVTSTGFLKLEIEQLGGYKYKTIYYNSITSIAD